MRLLHTVILITELGILTGCGDGGSSSLSNNAAENTASTVSTVDVNSGNTLVGTVVGSGEVNIIRTRRRLNDTGIITCGDYAYSNKREGQNVSGSDNHNNRLDCTAVGASQTTGGVDVDGDIVRAGQDAFYGRDVTHNNNSDGHAGFSYTQLDSSGNPLAVKSTNYTTSSWSCVKDNVTGLIWEVKALSGLQANVNTYTWYNSTGINDGGDYGIGDTGVGTTTGYYVHDTENYEGSDICKNTSRCDTEKYVADVNAINLCGKNNWRLPSRIELASIVNSNRSNPAIDIHYFPNTLSSTYWSSSPVVGDDKYAWYVAFFNGSMNFVNKNLSKHVRLVYGSE